MKFLAIPHAHIWAPKEEMKKVEVVTSLAEQAKVLKADIKIDDPEDVIRVGDILMGDYKEDTNDEGDRVIYHSTPWWVEEVEYKYPDNICSITAREMKTDGKHLSTYRVYDKISKYLRLVDYRNPCSFRKFTMSDMFLHQDDLPQCLWWPRGGLAETDNYILAATTEDGSWSFTLVYVYDKRDGTTNAYFIWGVMCEQWWGYNGMFFTHVRIGSTMSWDQEYYSGIGMLDPRTGEMKCLLWYDKWWFYPIVHLYDESFGLVLPITGSSIGIFDPYEFKFERAFKIVANHQPALKHAFFYNGKCLILGGGTVKTEYYNNGDVGTLFMVETDKNFNILKEAEWVPRLIGDPRWVYYANYQYHWTGDGLIVEISTHTEGYWNNNGTPHRGFFGYLDSFDITHDMEFYDVHPKRLAWWSGDGFGHSSPCNNSFLEGSSFGHTGNGSEYLHYYIGNRIWRRYKIEFKDDPNIGGSPIIPFSLYNYGCMFAPFAQEECDGELDWWCPHIYVFDYPASEIPNLLPEDWVTIEQDFTGVPCDGESTDVVWERAEESPYVEEYGPSGVQFVELDESKFPFHPDLIYYPPVFQYKTVSREICLQNLLRI